MQEDIKLIREVLKGNIDSFNIIVNKYELMVLKYVYSILKSRETAEDITQEVFITVYNKLYTFDTKYKFSNWLIQIAKNKSIDYIRKYKRVHEANIEEVYELKSSAPSPEEEAEFSETKQLIMVFINSLSEVDKQILLLRYSQDKTFQDIAEILELSESSVKRRYYKARDKFKAYKDKTIDGKGKEVRR